MVVKQIEGPNSIGLFPLFPLQMCVHLSFCSIVLLQFNYLWLWKQIKINGKWSMLSETFVECFFFKKNMFLCFITVTTEKKSETSLDFLNCLIDKKKNEVTEAVIVIGAICSIFLIAMWTGKMCLRLFCTVINKQQTQWGINWECQQT